jgi:hypothetical protein
MRILPIKFCGMCWFIQVEDGYGTQHSCEKNGCPVEFDDPPPKTCPLMDMPNLKDTEK